MAGTPGTYAFLGVAAANFMMCAFVLHPAALRLLQGSEQQLEQGQMTALELCANATVLLVWGAAQTFTVVTAFAETRRVSTALGKLLSLSNSWILAAVLNGAGDLLAGRRLGDGIYYHALYIGFTTPLVFCYVDVHSFLR